jgi:ATP-dependent Lon protease
MENTLKITRLQEQMKAIKEEVSQTRTEMKEGFDRIEKKLDCYVTKESYNHDMIEIEKKLGKQSNNWDWIIKTIMAVIIGALLTLVLKGL